MPQAKNYITYEVKAVRNISCKFENFVPKMRDVLQSVIMIEQE